MRALSPTGHVTIQLPGLVKAPGLSPQGDRAGDMKGPHAVLAQVCVWQHRSGGSSNPWTHEGAVRAAVPDMVPSSMSADPAPLPGPWLRPHHGLSSGTVQLLRERLPVAAERARRPVLAGGGPPGHGEVQLCAAGGADTWAGGRGRPWCSLRGRGHARRVLRARSAPQLTPTGASRCPRRPRNTTPCNATRCHARRQVKTSSVPTEDGRAEAQGAPGTGGPRSVREPEPCRPLSWEPLTFFPPTSSQGSSPTGNALRGSKVPQS